MPATEDVVPMKRIRIKFPTPKLSMPSGQSESKYGCGKDSEHKCDIRVVQLPDEELIADKLKVKPAQEGAKKRAAPEIMLCQKEKRQRLDCTVKQQCTCILRKLMAHHLSWPFMEPVDPVALKIPDYFSIISDPMDLGTIKFKLDKNMYFSSEDFAADVRLTFSNAVLYNPPDNYVHKAAKELNGIFEAKWKSVNSKVNHEMSKVGQGLLSSGREKDIPQLKQISKTTAAHDSLLLKKPMSFDEKEMLRKELLDLLKGKMPPDLRDFLKKLGKNQDRIKTLLDTFDDKVLWELKKVMKSNTGAAELDSRMAQKCGSKPSEKRICKGIGSNKREACGFSSDKLSSSLVGCNSGSCATGTYHCNRTHDSSHESSSDVSSDKPVIIDDPAKMVKNTSVVRNRCLNSDSDGAVSAVDEENSCPNSQFTASATVSGSVEEGDTPAFDVLLSPKKALRAAMLKSRFADTILKAQQRTLLDQCDKADPAKLQQEKERLQRKQLEERQRIEAQIKAAEAASSLKSESEVKYQREKERAAAKIALQQMERTVDIDDHLRALKDLEMLSGCSVSYSQAEVVLCELGNGGRHVMNPLEQLGLFLKDDYMGGDDDDGDFDSGEVGEEGEILC